MTRIKCLGMEQEQLLHHACVAEGMRRRSAAFQWNCVRYALSKCLRIVKEMGGCLYRYSST